jgi:methyl-accepting chemotaxis protein
MSKLIAETTSEQKSNSSKVLDALVTIHDAIQTISTSSENLYKSLYESADELNLKSHKLKNIIDYFSV